MCVIISIILGQWAVDLGQDCNWQHLQMTARDKQVPRLSDNLLSPWTRYSTEITVPLYYVQITVVWANIKDTQTCNRCKSLDYFAVIYLIIKCILPCHDKMTQVTFFCFWVMKGNIFWLKQSKHATDSFWHITEQ